MASTEPINKLIDTLEPYYTRDAPFDIPEDISMHIAKNSWLISLIIGVLSLPAIVAVIGINTFVGSVGPALGVTISPIYWLGIALLVCQALLFFAAVPGLKKLSYDKGWKLIFYAFMLSIATSLVMALAGDLGSLFGAILTFLVGLYLLFQIKNQFVGGSQVKKPGPDGPVGDNFKNDKNNTAANTDSPDSRNS